MQTLVDSGEVLQYKKYERPSVIRCLRRKQKPLIVKLWYPDKLITSDRFNPYSSRFVKNAEELLARGVAAPEVNGWGRIEPGHIRFVSYDELPGQTLDTALDQVDLDATARFVLTLHDAGIDFRSLHLGNILRDRSGAHSLIDITDCNFSSGPLPMWRRIRRLARFCNHRPEREYFREDARWSKFVMGYCQARQLSLEKTAAVHDLVRKRLLD